MHYICFLSPAIVSVMLLKNKEDSQDIRKDIIRDIRMYILSLAVVNALSNLLYCLFFTEKGSAWHDTSDSTLQGVAYIGIALVVAIIWGFFAEYMVQRYSFHIEAVDRKKGTKNEKKDNK